MKKNKRASSYDSSKLDNKKIRVENDEKAKKESTTTYEEQDDISKKESTTDEEQNDIVNKHYDPDNAGYTRRLFDVMDHTDCQDALKFIKHINFHVTKIANLKNYPPKHARYDAISAIHYTESAYKHVNDVLRRVYTKHPGLSTPFPKIDSTNYHSPKPMDKTKIDPDKTKTDRGKTKTDPNEKTIDIEKLVNMHDVETSIKASLQMLKTINMHIDPLIGEVEKMKLIVNNLIEAKEEIKKLKKGIIDSPFHKTPK